MGVPGYPRIIHFNCIFHYKPSVWGLPTCMETPIYEICTIRVSLDSPLLGGFMLDHHMKLQAVEIRDWKTR